MRGRVILLIGINIILVVATIMFVRSWMSSQQVEGAQTVKAPVEQEQVEVLVAEGDLSPGTLLREAHLKWKPWPEDGVGSSYISRERSGENKGKAEVVGAVVRFGIASGQPIVPGAIVKPGERGFLAAILSPGKRAISLPVTPASSSAGLIIPGDRVDVILTQRVKSEDAKERDRYVSETILRDLRTIAFDQKLDNNTDDKEASVARTATLEVTPRQAEVLAVALELGKLSLSLRSLEADESGTVSGHTATWDHYASLALRQPDSEKEDKVIIVRGRAQQAKSGGMTALAGGGQ